MKKTLALILAAMMVMALAACGGNSAPAEAPAAEAPAAAPAEAPAAAPAAEAPAAAPAEAPSAEAPAAAPSAEAPAAAPSAEAPAAAPAEVTWADYQKYLIDTAGVNAPDLDEFKGQVEAIHSWDEMPLDQSPWDQFFTTLGLSTWEEFQQGIVKELAVMGTASGDASSGEPSGEAPAA